MHPILPRGSDKNSPFARHPAMRPLIRMTDERPDAIFADPWLAVLYDVVDDDRSDLDAYERLVAELQVTSVLDIGCGTGTLACRLALAGIDVVGVDPALASLDVARPKPGADRMRWIHGDTSAVPEHGFDLALMTGNVAQVFVRDVDWERALTDIGRTVRTGGWLVFETRNPDRRAWERWNRAETYRQLVGPGDVGRFETWTEVIDVATPCVTFRHVFRFERDGSEIVSTSTMRFRTLDEITASLDRAGFVVRDVRDAPDRPGLEFVFVTQRSGATPT